MQGRMGNAEPELVNTGGGLASVSYMKLIVAVLLFTTTILAHPGSSIVVDAQGQVYFVDTGGGVWKIDRQGKLALVHKVAYHFMAIDPQGSFANAPLGEFDRGTFERITPAGAKPALIISSDYPIAVGRDGALYYVPYDASGKRELVRRTPEGKRSVFTTLPRDTGPKPMMWVNGIAVAPDESLYTTDHDAVRRIDRIGAVSTFRDAIQAPDCSDPLPDIPKFPYLRELAVATDGTVYAAANGCRSVIAIPAKGPVKTILKAERPWSPTGVALSGADIYVLEYLHTPGDDRKQWLPRVRKVAAGGKVTTIAVIESR